MRECSARAAYRFNLAKHDEFCSVQQGAVLIVNGSHFVSSSEVLISAQALSTTVVSSQQL